MALILRDYQEIVRQGVYDAWLNGFKNVLAVMPTGAGKTKTFCAITIDLAIVDYIVGAAKALRDKHGKVPTVIMVHRKELVQQICLTLAEEGIEHNIIAPRPVIKGIVAAERRVTKKQWYNYNAPVTVASVDTVNSRIARHQEWALGIRFWIVDEAMHVLQNNKWGKATTYFPNAIGLGVTATPERLDGRGLGRESGDGVFDIMVEGPTTNWLIKNGYLSKYKIARPVSDYKEYLKQAGSGADYTREALADAAKKSHIVGDVVAAYRKFAYGKQNILFAPDTESAKKMETKFLEAGIPAKLLTSDSTDEERLNGIIDFKNKKIWVLINVDLFDEGLDVPGIEVVQMARATMSLGKFLQMCGRGLRPVYAEGFDLMTTEGRLAAMAGGPKPFALIIDHVGNVSEHGLPDNLRSWTLERTVRRRDKVNLIRLCQNIDCGAPYDRLLDGCPHCGSAFVSNRAGGGGGGRLSPKEVDGDLVLLDPEMLRALEEAQNLEDPLDTFHRINKAAGINAAKHARAAQAERIETQKYLKDVIAQWAGYMRYRGLSDRQIHKQFYIYYEMTITEALSEPKAAMLVTIGELQRELKYLPGAKRSGT